MIKVEFRLIGTLGSNVDEFALKQYITRETNMLAIRLRQEINDIPPNEKRITHHKCSISMNLKED